MMTGRGGQYQYPQQVFPMQQGGTATPGRAAQQQTGTLGQYLANVLSQGGPNALPYSEDVKWGVRQHLIDLITEFPSLSVKVAPFTHNDGTMVNLLKFEGTAPMYFQGNKYNLPLTSWLLEGYPRAPPRVFLTPTQDMIIKPSHKFVDASGQVHTPYLDQWCFPSSNLRDLTHTLCIHFGQDPPLYSKPPNWRPGQQAYNNVQQQNRPAYNPGNASGFQAYNPMVSQGAQPQEPVNTQGSYPAVAQNSNNNSTTSRGTPPEIFREKAIATLYERMSKTLNSIENHASKHINDKLAEQKKLEERSGLLEVAVGQIIKERDLLDQSIHQYESKTKELEGWLEKHREIDKDIDLDGVFVPSDSHSQQAVDALSKDIAIEDTLYSLEQGLLNDKLDAQLYLKQVRMLSRKQFFHRALCKKIASLQSPSKPVVYSVGYANSNEDWNFVN